MSHAREPILTRILAEALREEPLHAPREGRAVLQVEEEGDQPEDRLGQDLQYAAGRSQCAGGQPLGVLQGLARPPDADEVAVVSSIRPLTALRRVGASALPTDTPLISELVEALADVRRGA